MNVILPNGSQLIGEEDEVRDSIARMGLNPLDPTDSGKMYLSGSRGLITIPGMNINHRMNAIRKYYRLWANELSAIKDPGEFMLALTNGPQNKTWLALCESVAVDAKAKK